MREVRLVASTAEAVREVGETEAAWAALGDGVRGGDSMAASSSPTESRTAPTTSPASSGSRRPGRKPTGGSGSWRTSLVFSELGEDHPGALVEALTEFSRREVNLTRIESRPLRRGLGRYMFFLDLDGPIDDPVVSEAIGALRGKAETVRVLGSYPVEGAGLPSA